MSDLLDWIGFSPKRLLAGHHEEEEEEEEPCDWDVEPEVCAWPYPNCYADDFAFSFGDCDGYTVFDWDCYPCDNYLLF